MKLMIFLPSLVHKTKSRPYRNPLEESYLIPNHTRYSSFWQNVYTFVRTLKLKSPVTRSLEQYIDPLFGYFGMRVHPVTMETKYFHAGISLSLKSGRKIYPIADGVLEYSGYGAVDGYYVLISHPNIQTEDGYILHSMYCHLKKPLVKFNSYQKMLREISLGSHPLVKISSQTILGIASTSGLARENFPGLYFQLSFRKFGKQTIVIDPLQAYQKVSQENITANIVSKKAIKGIYGKPLIK